MLDLIIKDALVLTMTGRGIGMIPNGAVGVKANIIECVGDSSLIAKEYKAKRVINAKGKVLLPGFINVHCHSSENRAGKGILTDLEYYLEQGYPAYEETSTIDMEIMSCKAFLLEGIKRGTTTFGDIGSHYDIISKVHDQFGVRARIAENLREMPWDIMNFIDGEYEFDRKYAQQGIDAMYRLLEKYGTDPNNRISAMVSFQALDYVTEELVVELGEAAKKYNAMIHTHMSQSPREIEQVEKRFGSRPVDAFERLGLLNENTLAAHLVYNRKSENEKAAKSGVKMAYCPCSWCEVGVSPPSAQYLHSGGVVGIGSDEAAYTGVNPVIDMKLAHLNTNVDAFNNNVATVPMSMILRMQTIEAARALGMEDQVGSLEVNKKADIIIFNPNCINMTPVLIHPLTNVPQNIVSSATGTEIETVIIDGQIIMEENVIKVVNEAEIIEQIQALAQESSVGAAAYFKKLAFSEIIDRQRWFEQQ